MAEKKIYGKWSQDDLERAMAAFKNGDCGLNECCRMYGVPKPTLKRHLLSKNAYANGNVKVMGRGLVFTKEMEDDLEHYLLQVEEMFLGLTIKDVRRLAFDFAEKNQLNHNFNKDSKMAGKKWFYSFMKRHPKLSVRQPEATSLARARGFSKENVFGFFDLYEKIVDNNQLDGTRIYNVDESGFTTVQKNMNKIVGQKGKKQIGGLKSAERGVTTTMVCCVNAAGHYIPPMIIFKRMRMNDALKIGAPLGSIVEVSESGYINADLFSKYLRHFIAQVGVSLQRKVLLLLDGHVSHSKNLEVIDICRENGVILLTLPAHTTHRLQPLDIGFFSPLKSYYDAAIETWIRSNIGSAVSQYQVCQLLNEAYGRACTVAIAEKSFKASGIWPVNRFIFDDHDFAPATLLNVNSPVVSPETSPAPTPSNEPNSSLLHRPNQVPTFIRAQEISPITVNKSSKRPQQAVELTSSPYKSELAAKKLMTRKCKAQLLSSEPSTSKTNNSKKMKKSADPGSQSESIEAETGGVGVVFEKDDSDWFCSLCETCKIENMTQCTSCNSWVHDSCAGIKRNAKYYICSACSMSCE